jgi:hypothetical protein
MKQDNPHPWVNSIFVIGLVMMFFQAWCSSITVGMYVFGSNLIKDTGYPEILCGFP